MKNRHLPGDERANASLLFLILRFSVFLLIALSLSVPLGIARPLLNWLALGYFALSEILLLLRAGRWMQQRIAIGIYFLDVYAVSSLILFRGLSALWYLTIPILMLGVSRIYNGKRSWLLISLIPSVLVLLQLSQQKILLTERIWEYGGIVFLFLVFSGAVHSMISGLEGLRALSEGQRKLVLKISHFSPPPTLDACMEKILGNDPPFEMNFVSILFRDDDGNLRGRETRRTGEIGEVRIGATRLPSVFEDVPSQGCSLSHLSQKGDGSDYFKVRSVGSLLVKPVEVDRLQGIFLMGRAGPSAFSSLEEKSLLLYGELVQGWLRQSSGQQRPLPAPGDAGETGNGESSSRAKPEPGKGADLKEKICALEKENRMLQEVIDDELHSETLELKKTALSVLSKESEQNQEVLERLASAELSQAVSHLFDMHLILDLILEVICKKLKVENASIMLLREESRDLIICAHRGLKDEVVRKTRLMVGEAIAGYVAQKGEPLLIEDIRKDPRFVPFSRERYRSGTLLSVPIMRGDTVLGVINLSDPAQDGPFQDRDLEVLQAMSRQASIVIENDRMYQEFKNGQWIREIYEEELSQRVSEKVFQEGQVLEEVAGEYPVTILSIHLHEPRTSTAVDSRERIRQIEQCFQECRQILVRRQGDVAGETGAGMIGLFGLPFSDAKDPWQAVLAAVDLLKAFAGKRPQSGPAREEGFGVSMGVSTGMVLLREKQGAVPYAVFGETWERGVTLMHAASPGQILVDEATHERIGGYVNALRLILPYGINKQLTAFGIKGMKKQYAAEEPAEV